MRNKYLKPFNVDLYNELFDSSTPFQVVNGKDEPVDIINTEVTINGESGNVLYQTVDGSYFTVDRNGKHAKDPTFCDLYIKTPPPYKPFPDVGVTNLENVKKIIDMVRDGKLLKVELTVQGGSDGTGFVNLKAYENEKKYGNTSFTNDSFNDMESFIDTLIKD